MLFLILYAPYIVGLDLLFGFLTGASFGVLQLAALWLSLMTKVVFLVGFPPILAKVLIGIWGFITLGLDFSMRITRRW